MTDSTNKTCDDFTARIDAFHDGELSASESQEVSMHINACDECRLRLSQIEQVVSILRSLPRIEPKKDLAEDLDEFVKKTVSASPRRIRAVILSSLSVAAAFVVLLITGGFIVQRWQDASFPPANVQGASVQARREKPESISRTKLAQSNTKRTKIRATSLSGVPLLTFYATDQTTVSEELGIMTNEDGLYALKL